MYSNRVDVEFDVNSSKQTPWKVNSDALGMCKIGNFISLSQLWFLDIILIPQFVMGRYVFYYWTFEKIYQRKKTKFWIWGDRVVFQSKNSMKIWRCFNGLQINICYMITTLSNNLHMVYKYSKCQIIVSKSIIITQLQSRWCNVTTDVLQEVN